MVDDRRLNEITITTLVTTDNPWHNPGWGKVFFSPESGFDYVLEAPEGRRRFPFDIGDVREGRITTLIRTTLPLTWPDKAKVWDFGGLRLSFTPRRTAEGYEAVRDYTVLRPWLSADEKLALDRAHDEIGAYDRMSICVPPRPVMTWRSGLLTRAAVWIGAPVVGLLIWLAGRFLVT
jgi:hypothetical protein